MDEMYVTRHAHGIDGHLAEQPPSHDRRLVLLRESGEGRSGFVDGKDGETHLENLFRIRPAGVTSKKDIGDRKIAVAILSCSFLDA